MEYKERALTYSLLAQIRNNGDLIKGPLDIFIPLLKRTLSTINKNGIFKGQSVIEIKYQADKDYSLDFPIPVLYRILDLISKDVNTAEKKQFVLHTDGSFQISEYTFTEFDNIIIEKKENLNQLEELFAKFKSSHSDKIDGAETLFKFIEKNKYSLSRYISNGKVYKNGDDFTIEALFIETFQGSKVIFDQIKDIYLGAILSSYLDINIKQTDHEVELLLDTNFIIGLLDLNTQESTHTCNTLINIANTCGYKITVLKCTIEESENLLRNKAANFNKSFLVKNINPEDVFNACERRKLSQVDLERIADNIENLLCKMGVNIIFHHEKLTHIAKNSTELEKFEKIRQSKISALHDATAVIYVQQKRGKSIYEFEKVNCWFVNNSASYFSNVILSKNALQPEIIRVDDLVNILWLSNPAINKMVTNKDLTEIGISSIISFTLSKDLPKAKVLKELDDNINKYSKEKISEVDIVRIAKRIANKQLKDIEELNALANNDGDLFNQRLSEEAFKQKEIEINTAYKLNNAFDNLKELSIQAEKEKLEYKNKNEASNKAITDANQKLHTANEEVENFRIELKRLKMDQYIERQMTLWKRNNSLPFLISLGLLILMIIIVFANQNFNFKRTIDYCKNNEIMAWFIGILLLIINAFTFKLFYDCQFNHSNITNKQKNLKVPKEFE